MIRSNERVTSVEITPTKFYALAEVMQTIPQPRKDGLKAFIKKTEEYTDVIDEQVRGLQGSHNDLIQQLRLSTPQFRQSFRQTLTVIP